MYLEAKACFGCVVVDVVGGKVSDVVEGVYFFKFFTG
jgi:hypothetical protein